MERIMRVLLVTIVALLALLLCADERMRTILRDQIHSCISEAKKLFERPMTPSELRAAQKEWQRFWMVDKPSHITQEKNEDELLDNDD